MRYVLLAADYLEPVLRDENSGEDLLLGLRTQEGLAERIEAWNADYQPIIPLDGQARLKAVDLIDALDRAGLMLAAEVADALADGSKVRYFSEGRLRHLQ